MSGQTAQITIGGTTFDDAEAGVVHLHVGDPTNAVDFDESPEGYHLRFDSDGRMIGITMVGV